MIRKAVTLFTLLLLLNSCGAKDVDKIGDAQQCLDTATKATASKCMDLVAGIESAGAFNVRCASKFIGEGFGTTELLQTLEALSGTSGSLTNFLDYIAFSSQQDITNDDISASDTFGYCYKSSSKGATLLAAFSNIATSIYKMLNSCKSSTCPVIPGGSTGKYEVQACINGALGDLISCGTTLTNIANPSTSDTAVESFQSSIGSIIISTHQLSCSGTGANKTLCDKFSTAITSAGGVDNRRAVAVQFLNTLLTPP